MESYVMILLNWSRLPHRFYTLNDVESANNALGVFIIWKSSRVIYVGKGQIRDCLLACMNDRKIAKYRVRADSLIVSWAEVSPSDVEGVQRFLVEKLRPLENDQLPGARPIPVIFPWPKDQDPPLHVQFP